LNQSSIRNQNSLVCAMGWMIEVQFLVGVGNFLFLMVSRLVLWPTQPHIQWVPTALFQWVKQLECETDHSPPTSANVKNDGAIPPHGMVLTWLSRGAIYLYFTSPKQQLFCMKLKLRFYQISVNSSLYVKRNCMS
jgi:hypothetical protein